MLRAIIQNLWLPASGFLLFLVALTPLHAGDSKAPAASAEASSPFSGSLATGWDSLYMFRGVNQLPGPNGYGSSISWTALTLSWSPTANDSLTLASWSAFGLTESNYKEIDASLAYTRTIGHLSLTAGYYLYTVLSEPGGLYSNELQASATYAIALGPVTLTPGLTYAYTLGPSPDHGGYIKPNTGYLEARLDAEIPLYHDIIKAAPYASAGFSFAYNSTESANDTTQPLTGADHFELGLTLPIALTSSLELAPYLSYSHTWLSLPGTRRNTTWAGVALTFSF